MIYLGSAGMEGHTQECAGSLCQDPGIHWVTLISFSPDTPLSCFLSAHVWKSVLRKQSLGTFRLRYRGITTLLRPHSPAFWPPRWGWARWAVWTPRATGLDLNSDLWISLWIWGLDETAWSLHLKTLLTIRLKQLQSSVVVQASVCVWKLCQTRPFVSLSSYRRKL